MSQAGSVDPIDVVPALGEFGAPPDLAAALEQYRPYLLLIAEQELDSALRPKAGASDLVQQTLWKACRGLEGLRGCGEETLKAWLRQILLNCLADEWQKYAADKRRLSRERPIDGDAGTAPRDWLVARDPSASDCLIAREETEALLAALERLPEQYRHVIEWRNRDRLPFDEIGKRLDRSADACRLVWYRALRRLEEELKRDLQ